MAHLQMLYSEWLDKDLVAGIQNKSPPIIFSLASFGFGGNLNQLFFVNNPSILLRPDKYNILAFLPNLTPPYLLTLFALELTKVSKSPTRIKIVENKIMKKIVKFSLNQ